MSDSVPLWWIGRCPVRATSLDEAKRLRDARRCATAVARGKTIIGMKGHRHSPDVLEKMRKSMKRWCAENPDAKYAQVVKAVARIHGIDENLAAWWIAMRKAAAEASPRTRKHAQRRKPDVTKRALRVVIPAVSREDNLELLRMFSRVLSR